MIRYGKRMKHVLTAALMTGATAACLGPGGALGDDQDDDVLFVGTISVSTLTTGDTPDADGYLASLDESRVQPIDPIGAVTFENVPAGTYGVLLSGVDGACTVVQPNPTFVTLLADSSLTTHFDVDCP